MKGALAFAGHLGLRGPDAPLFAHGARSVDPLDQIDALAERGFVGVQDVFLKLRDPSVRAAMAARMAARGLRMGTFNGNPLHWNTPLWSSADETAHALLSTHLAENARLVEEMGGGSSVCVCGTDPDLPHDVQLSGMVENLKRQGEAAAQSGLVLLVEPVASAWIPGLLVATLADAAAIVRAVDLPSVRLLFDTGHVAMAGDDVLAGLRDHWDIIGGVQVSDAPGRVDVGTGELDWAAIFGWLIEQGYSGLVEVEHDLIDPTAEGEARMVERLRALSPPWASG